MLRASVLLLLLSLCSICSDAQLSSSPARKGETLEVVYFYCSNGVNDTKGRSDFIKFGDALVRARIRDRVELVYVQVDGEGDALHLAAQKIVDSRPYAVFASSQDAMEGMRHATSTIPILFVSHIDPVMMGDVLSLSRPGVRRTGITFYAPIAAKEMEILSEAFPNIKRVGVLSDQFTILHTGLLGELAEARQALGIDTSVFLASTLPELQIQLRLAGAASVDAWYVPVGDLMASDFDGTVHTMREIGKPVIYTRTNAVLKGGTLAYEPFLPEPYDILARQLSMMLMGVDVTSIPVEHPTIFKLAVNLDTSNLRPQMKLSKSIVKRADTTVPVSEEFVVDQRLSPR
jgi:putative tryptophan/tyrosine transport system substrate-binding protein